MSPEQHSDVELLVEIFGWDDSWESKYHALRILCQARGVVVPSPDDYRAWAGV